MISWIYIMLLFLHYQKLFNNFDPLDIWIPPPNELQSFVCISYLFDKIYHYIRIISMISWIVVMLLFWHYQKLSQLNPGKKISRGVGVKISYNILTPLDIFTPPPQIINDKVLFVFHIYLTISIIISKSY